LNTYGIIYNNKWTILVPVISKAKTTTTTHTMSFRFFLSLLLILHKSNGFLLLPSTTTTTTNAGNKWPSSSTTLRNIAQSATNAVDGEDIVDLDGGNEHPIDPSKISSSSSEYQEPTDRFKYKVHALMGTYDPAEGEVDDEGQDGNILKAMLSFPTQYVFHVVGRKNQPSTNDDDDDDNNNNDDDDYASSVRKIIYETTGDDNIECEIIPRGKRFIKVQCEAKVESATMINTIYNALGQMESTVMKF
jgi:putative lipoic acid-binding regulatory protein